ncbi:hypothetical protein ACLOJK_018805 [Asimina triloba]
MAAEPITAWSAISSVQRRQALHPSVSRLRVAAPPSASQRTRSTAQIQLAAATINEAFFSDASQHRRRQLITPTPLSPEPSSSLQDPASSAPSDRPDLDSRQASSTAQLVRRLPHRIQQLTTPSDRRCPLAPASSVFSVRPHQPASAHSSLARRQI